MALGERGRHVGFLVRDRDAKLSRAFDNVFASEGAKMLRTPVRAPTANADAERWVGSARVECLGWLLIVGRGHLEQVLRVDVQHYNQHRPHRALSLHAPGLLAEPIVVGRDRQDTVHRRDLLGGLVHQYRRAHECICAPYRLEGLPDEIDSVG